MSNPKKVAVGLSGGVDSAMAAYLLQEQGYAVTALTMSIWDDRQPLVAVKQNACYGPGEKEDIAAAQAIAAKLKIPHHTIDLAREYEEWVLEEFRTQRLAGLTPNPCALCNPRMKFGLLPTKARALGIEFDYFATGHYVRITTAPDNTLHLLRGLDPQKDQSYFLAHLTQSQLATTLFPLGDKTKSEVRLLAQQVDLGYLTEQPESQDFFEGEDISLLFNQNASQPGAIIDEQGNKLGEHRGIIHYTIGQRDGLGIAVGQRVYVSKIDPTTNTITVAPRAGVFATGCHVKALHWIAGTPPPTTAPLTVLLRYRHTGAAARLTLHPPDQATLHFDTPQFAVTPGQMAAIYCGAELLGGGWITQALL